MVFQGIREDFLSNAVNTHKLLYILADAYLLIVHNVIAAHTNPAINTILVADDTDILIMLCWHVKPTTPCIYFRPEPRQQTKSAPRCWYMSVVRTFLGPDVCKNIVCMHAILGVIPQQPLWYREGDRPQVDGEYVIP